MTKKSTVGILLSSAAILFAPAALAQEEPAPVVQDEEDFGFTLDEGPVKEPDPVYTSEIEIGGGLASKGSYKFGEYSGVNDKGGFVIGNFRIQMRDPWDSDTGKYWTITGENLGLTSRSLGFEYGKAGKFSVYGNYDQTPRYVSQDAMTPYDYLGGGVFHVSDDIVNAIQVSNVGSASSWTAPNAGPGGVGEDSRISAVLINSVHPVDLSTQRKEGTAGATVLLSKTIKAGFEFSRETKKGSILSGAAIGDRPPRSMTVQLAAPIDQSTEDFKVSLEYIGKTYQADVAYRYSKFNNELESMTWNSLFHAPGYFNAGATDYDDIRTGKSTSYATTGRSAVNPDNTYQNIALNFGAILPKASRFSARFSFGTMKQNESLLPYATSGFGGVLDALPRTSADAEIQTTMMNFTYNISPVRGLTANLHYRYYDLDNKTPQSEFDYYTQDSDSQNYRNERINLGYGYRETSYGLDLNYYAGRAGTFGFNYEREKETRDNREVEQTDEDIFEFSYRVRLLKKISINAKYIKAKRDGSPYNSEITDLSYHYDPIANAGQADNPLLGFGNNPSLRKFDVTDRDKDQFNVSVGFSPTDTVNVNLGYSHRENDYTSSISSTLTTWDSALGANIDTSIDPTQLGLLDDKVTSFTADVSFSPVDGLDFYGFYSKIKMDSNQRGRYLNENARINNIAAGKDWQNTDGDLIWDAAFTDKSDTFGIGTNYVISDDYELEADYTHTKGTVDIDYRTGFEIAEDDTTGYHNHAEWSSPDQTKFTTNTVNLSITRKVSKHMRISFRYMYEDNDVTDWQQEATGAHQVALNDNFVADQDPETAGTSNDRVGSRLVRLTGLLAPSYSVNVFHLTMKYVF